MYYVRGEYADYLSGVLDFSDEFTKYDEALKYAEKIYNAYSKYSDDPMNYVWYQIVKGDIIKEKDSNEKV